MPNLNISKHLSQTLTCLSTGSWDNIALRCTPKCGRVTQAATAYVIGGKKVKNVAEVRNSFINIHNSNTKKFEI